MIWYLFAVLILNYFTKRTLLLFPLCITTDTLKKHFFHSFAKMSLLILKSELHTIYTKPSKRKKEEADSRPTLCFLILKNEKHILEGGWHMNEPTNFYFQTFCTMPLVHISQIFTDHVDDKLFISIFYIFSDLYFKP